MINMGQDGKWKSNGTKSEGVAFSFGQCGTEMSLYTYPHSLKHVCKSKADSAKGENTSKHNAEVMVANYQYLHKA